MKAEGNSIAHPLCGVAPSAPAFTAGLRRWSFYVRRPCLQLVLSRSSVHNGTQGTTVAVSKANDRCDRMTTQTARLDDVAENTALPDKMTYEAFLTWADGRHAEWVDGEVQLLVSPVTQRHQQIARFLIRILSEFVEAYDLGVVLFAPFQMKLPAVRRGREPDVLFIARERL